MQQQIACLNSGSDMTDILIFCTISAGTLPNKKGPDITQETIGFRESLHAVSYPKTIPISC